MCRDVTASFKQQKMNRSTMLQQLLFLVILSSSCLCAPYQELQTSKISNREAKKDIFLSRGWGAGGMPFSVLYMNPSFSSSKAPATVETHFRPQKSQHKSVPQVRTSMRQKSMNRTPHSVIPQLFVSYGWGPLGKK